MRNICRRQAQIFSVSLMAMIGMLIVASSIASAGSATQHAQEVKTSMAQEAKITIEQAILTASKAQSGTVLKAELEKEHGPLMWELEILSADGVLHEIHVDGEHGKLIGLHAQKDTEEKTGTVIQAGTSDKKSEQSVDPAPKQDTSTEEPVTKKP